MAIQYDTFDDLLSITPEAFKDMVHALKALISSIDPSTVEVVRMGDRAATYGVGPKKMKEGYVYIMPQKQWVNLGFYQGAELKDPSGLLEGTGKSLRHVKVKDRKSVEAPELANLIREAIALRKTSF
jgi:hypothetical protein